MTEHTSPPEDRSTVLPRPVAASLGLLAKAAGQARAAALEVPVAALRVAVLSASDLVRIGTAVGRRYDVLAGRGMRAVQKLRSGDEPWEPPVPHAPVASGRGYDVYPFEGSARRWVDEADEGSGIPGVGSTGGGGRDTAARAATPPRSKPAAVRKPAAKPSAPPAPAAEAPAAKRSTSTATGAAATSPAASNGVVPPKAAPPKPAAARTPAPKTPAPRTPTAASLPVDDFDHVTLGSLRARLRRLSVPDLKLLLTYERAHAARPEITTLLANRIEKLQGA